MKEIPLSRGQVCKVDDDWYEELAKHKWYLSKKGYAVRNVQYASGKRATVYMHRVIANTPYGAETDHRDVDTKNNQASNLRTCTTAQNCCNRRKHRDNTSGYKGVSFHKRDKMFFAQIMKGGKNHFLGYFDTPEEAHAAYVLASPEYHGDFARLS